MALNISALNLLIQNSEKKMSDNNITYRSFRFLNPIDNEERRATVAFKSTHTDAGLNITAAFSVCAPVDDFHRKFGQHIAKNRLDDGTNTVFIHSDNKHDKYIEDRKMGNTYFLHDTSLTETFREVLMRRGLEKLEKWGLNS